VEFLLTKMDSVIVDLCDFMLQDKSPRVAQDAEKRIEMGAQLKKYKPGDKITFSSTSFCPITELVATASHLIRCKYTP